MKLKYLLQINLIGYALLLYLAGCHATAALPTETPTLVIPTKLATTMMPSSKTPSLTATSTAITDDFIKIQYDEKNWTYHPLDEYLPEGLKKQKQTNQVRSIVFSPDGAAWVGTDAGLWTYINGVWKVFLAEDGLANDAAYSVAISPNGDVWVASNGGISRFDGNKWQISLMADIREIAISPDETVWALPDDYGIYYFDGKTWQFVYIDADKEIKGTSLTANENGIWVSTYYHGIFKFDGNIWEQFAIGTMTGLYTAPDKTVWAVQEKYYHDTMRPNVVQLNGNEWVDFDKSRGPRNYMQIYEVSRDGVIWGVQTENLQLFYFTIVLFEKENGYLFSGLPFKFIFDIRIAPDGTVWVGTEKGLYIYHE